MQAIITKYMPWTNTRPSRIKARATGGESLVSSFPLDGSDAHDHAVRQLAAKLNWTPCEFVRGATKDGYVYVFAGDHKLTIPASPESGAVSLPLLAMQAAIALGLASGVASVVEWAKAAIGGAL